MTVETARLVELLALFARSDQKGHDFCWGEKPGEFTSEEIHQLCSEVYEHRMIAMGLAKAKTRKPVYLLAATFAGIAASITGTTLALGHTPAIGLVPMSLAVLCVTYFMIYIHSGET